MSSIFFQKELEEIKKKSLAPNEIIEEAKKMRAKNKTFISIVVAAVCCFIWLLGFINNL